MTRSANEIAEVLGRLSRQHGPGRLSPDAAALRDLLAADRDGPLHFLNLLAYHETARYPMGHELAGRGLSGAEAYGLYGEVAIRHVTQRGGRLVAFNQVEQGLIGADGPWHQVAIMQYPDTRAFIDMLLDPDYTAALVHRDAGLERTALLVTRPLLRDAGGA